MFQVGNTLYSVKCLTCPHSQDFGTDLISRNRHATNHTQRFPTHDVALLDTEVRARWTGSDVLQTLL